MPTPVLISSAIEFGPLVVFFFGTELGNFFIGTALLIISTFVALTVSLIRDKRIPLFSLITSNFVVFFGSATLFFHNPLWLVIEYTLYNGLFGISILIALLFDKPLLKPLFKGMFHLTDHGWKTLSFHWGIFFLCAAFLNEYVWHHYNPEHWVFFRLGMAIILCLFGLLQLRVTQRERLPDANKWGFRL